MQQMRRMNDPNQRENLYCNITIDRLTNNWQVHFLIGSTGRYIHVKEYIVSAFMFWSEKQKRLNQQNKKLFGR